MTFDNLVEELEAGRRVHKRTCRICKGPISYGTVAHGPAKGRPCLYSCRCRAKHQSNVVMLDDWETLEAVWEQEERAAADRLKGDR